MAISFRDFDLAFRDLGLGRDQPVIAHASLSAFGEVRGGAETLLGVLLNTVNTVIMPTFTYRTMLIPEEGPEGNASVYGSGKDTNRMAEFYQPEMQADTLMGTVAETLRRRPKAERSSHPILSFTGVNAAAPLQAQTLAEPMAPIGKLTAQEGWVVLLGVDHTVNTSIHYAEKLAGRKQFIRWALTPQGVKECPGFPGCSDGFEVVASRLSACTRKVSLGSASIQAVPLLELVKNVQEMISEDPLAMLCARPVCERCDAVRSVVVAH